MQEDKGNKRHIDPQRDRDRDVERDKPLPTTRRDDVDKSLDREPGVLNAPDPWRNPWDDDDEKGGG